VELAGDRENSLGSSVFEGKNSGSKRGLRRTHLEAYYGQRELGVRRRYVEAELSVPAAFAGH